MKKQSISIVSLCLLFVSFISCKEEYTIQPKEHPFLITQEVTHINSTGATFHAKVLNKGNEEITDFGFIWVDRENEFQYSLKGISTLEDFTLRVSSDLEKGRPYICRAYIKNDFHMVLGNTVSFDSKGSHPPIIDDFTPKEGFYGTIITLNGKNFSLKPQRNKVFVNNTPTEVISSSDSQIVFKLPASRTIGDALIELRIGRTTVPANSMIKILGAETPKE